ncbi:MAG: flavodoxin family protein [Bacteroidales bacterium]|nr:flavodoxin family protein [Bacteroidales bacterium]
MKVLLVNGSPHKEGCTYIALSEVAKTLDSCGIETEIFHIGNAPVAGCIGCGQCKQKGTCFRDDVVNAFAAKTATADAFVFGSPVHFASATGSITAFMDRVFMLPSAQMAYKPAASVVSCRRGGATASFDQLNKYFTIRCMPVISSNYWNMVHGSCAADVAKDEEGLQTMRVLGRNMAWILKCIEAGRQNGINRPEPEQKIYTNYIR